MENKNNNQNGFGNGFVLGLLVGIVATLFITTKRGRELFKELTEKGFEKFSDLEEKLQEKTRDFQDEYEEMEEEEDDYVPQESRPETPRDVRQIAHEEQHGSSHKPSGVRRFFRKKS